MPDSVQITLACYVSLDPYVQCPHTAPANRIQVHRSKERRYRENDSPRGVHIKDRLHLEDDPTNHPHYATQAPTREPP